MRDNILCVLDIGSYSIKIVSVKLWKDFSIKNVFHADVKCEGLKRGEVIDLRSFTDSLEEAIKRIEDQQGNRVNKVDICLDGENIKGYDSEGFITISETGKEIEDSDVKKSIDSAKLLSIPMDRKILHIYKQGFEVDAQPGIISPVGMFGSKLKSKLYIVTGLESKIQNVVNCINNLGLQTGKVAFSGYMNVYGSLTDEDIRTGAVVLDMGADSTSLVSIKGKVFLNIKIFPFGGNDITKNIKRDLKIPFDKAEEKKKEIISFYPEKEVKNSLFGKEDKQIIESIYDSVNNNLEKIKKYFEPTIIDLASENFIIIGGVSGMGGLLEFIEEKFKIKTKLAQPKFAVKTDYRLVFSENHRYNACVGMINYLLKDRITKYSGVGGKLLSVFNDFKSFFSEYF